MNSSRFLSLLNDINFITFVIGNEQDEKNAELLSGLADSLEQVKVELEKILEKLGQEA